MAALTAALDRPGTDLSAILAVLLDDLRVGIPSFVAVRVTVLTATQPIVLTAAVSDTPVVVTVQIQLQLPPGPPGCTGAVLELSAGAIGALDAWAADVRRITGDEDGAVVRQLPPVRACIGTDLAGLDAVGEIDQALGVLIDRGLDPDAARADLDRRSAEAGGDRHRAARRVLDGVRILPSSVRDRSDPSGCRRGPAGPRST
ncbi:hypothetical protein [Nakamurella leprariae]|uniref:ANTAR domain-containing protein n=1 Tax=Nakamurella leprariae TaxID=2803911 RepID=A0A939BYH6_9ACTN|nr:hypothetical protein [Nakamurella leprariae]MBM9467095.1 hypothetical protein [Nakamurella leprariae]